MDTPSTGQFTYNNSPTTKEHKKNHRLLVAVFVTSLLAIMGSATFVLISDRTTNSSDDTAIKQDDQKSTKSYEDLSASTISTKNLSEAYDSFSNAGIVEFTPDAKIATLNKIASLTKGFSIDDKFYEQPANMLLTLSIGYLSSQDQNNDEAYRNEMYLLMSTFMESVPEGITDEYFRNAEPADKTLAVFSKYTDTDLTPKMEEALKNANVEKEIATNLGVEQSQIKPYTPIVFNFDTNDATQQQFSSEHYMFGAYPKMWVEEIDNKIYILFTKEYAKSFIADQNGSGRTSILHELVHSQQSFVKGELGRTIEERRAELFSGDKSAYYDAKQLFIYLEVFSGDSILSMLEQSPANPDDFYLLLFKELGVSISNKLVASWPNVYLGSPSTAVKKVVELTGGMDGVIKDSILIGKKDWTAVESRMKARTDKLLSVFSTKEKVLSDLQYSLGEGYSMPSAAAEMKKYIESNY